MPYGERCPLPALIFHTALSIPRSQLSHCVPLCCSSRVLHSTTCGIGPLSLLHSCPSLVSDSRATLPLLLVLPPFAWTLASAGPHQIVCGRSCWAYDPFPGCRAARHPGLSLSYTLGEASSGYFFSCLLECLALSTVVSCVLPNSTLHSARLIPCPYLVCWTGLRALCLAVTISCKLSAAKRSRPHQRQLDHECDGVQYHSPLGREAELVLVSQSWEIHAHDRATFSVNLLIFLLTHTAAT